MGYIRRKARNVGFHSRRHAERASVAEVHKVLTKVAAFGLTIVTVKRNPEAYKRIARENFPNGMPERDRRPGVLSVPGAKASIKPVIKLRANYAARMGEGG